MTGEVVPYVEMFSPAPGAACVLYIGEFLYLVCNSLARNFSETRYTARVSGRRGTGTASSKLGPAFFTLATDIQVTDTGIGTDERVCTSQIGKRREMSMRLRGKGFWALDGSLAESVGAYSVEDYPNPTYLFFPPHHHRQSLSR